VQTGSASDGTDGALAAHQNDLYIAAVLIRNQVRREARSAREMHELDIIARAVYCLIRRDIDDLEVGSNQIKIFCAQ